MIQHLWIIVCCPFFLWVSCPYEFCLILPFLLLIAIWLAYVLWFMHRYGLQLELGALACWERLSCKLSTVFRRRQLLLYALKQDSVPDGFQDPSMSVNVHRMGLDAQARSLYALRDVTGLDFEVQAVLLTKACTALSLLAVCEAIGIN